MREETSVTVITAWRKKERKNKKKKKIREETRVKKKEREKREERKEVREKEGSFGWERKSEEEKEKKTVGTHAWSDHGSHIASSIYNNVLISIPKNLISILIILSSNSFFLSFELWKIN